MKFNRAAGQVTGVINRNHLECPRSNKKLYSSCYRMVLETCYRVWFFTHCEFSNFVSEARVQVSPRSCFFFFRWLSPPCSRKIRRGAVNSVTREQLVMFALGETRNCFAENPRDRFRSNRFATCAQLFGVFMQIQLSNLAFVWRF